MKIRMNHKRIIALLIAALMCVGMNPLNAMAAETESPEVIILAQSESENWLIDGEDAFSGLYNFELNDNVREIGLTKCSILMSYTDDYLHIELLTGCSDEATEIGVKDIKVQKKVGIFWTTVATSAGGSVANDTIFSGSCNSYTVEKGETYRVVCTHYAYINGKYYSLENVTDGHKFV